MELLSTLAASTGDTVSTALALALKGALLVGVGLLLDLGLRRRSAALRHGLWTSVLVALLILPLAAAMAPAWHVPLLPAIAIPQAPGVTVTTPDVGNDGAVGHARPAGARSGVAARTEAAHDSPASTAGPILAAPSPSPSPSKVAAALWAIGSLALLLRLVVAVAFAERTVRLATDVEDAPWRRATDEAARSLGYRGRVRIARSALVSMPMTWGIRRHTVLLPPDSDGWSTERRKVVLVHEIAHVARGDCLSQLVSGAATALHWFNPLVWLARRRQMAERELACDDAVLRSGTVGADYARHLLEIARASSGGRRLAPAAAMMARRSQLEGRLLAALDGRRERHRPTPGMTTAVFASALLVVIPLAALRPWAAPALQAQEAIAEPAAANEKEPTRPTLEPPAGAASAEPVPLAGAEPTTTDSEPAAAPIQESTQEPAPRSRRPDAATRSRVRDALVRVLGEDADAEMRESAVQALGNLEDPATVPPLSQALGADDSAAVRAQAAWALGMIESADGVPALVGALDDDDENVRSQAAWALGMIESSQGVDGLVRALLQDESPGVRAQAAWALGMIEDASAVDALVQAIQDAAPQVRKQALWALGMVTG